MAFRGRGGEAFPGPQPWVPVYLAICRCTWPALGPKEPHDRMLELTPIKRRWQPIGHLWPILGAACLGIAVAASAWFAVSAWEERLAKAKFNDVAGDYAAVLQSGIDGYLGKIGAVRAFYDASHAVDPNEFDLFTARILEGHDAIMRITWSPRVTGDERAEFERKVRDEGIDGYHIMAWVTGDTPVSALQESEYFPVLYSTGIPTALSVLGIDFNTEPNRREALARARWRSHVRRA